MTTKPELSDSELVEKCRQRIDHLNFAGFKNATKELTDLLTRFEKAQKENEWIDVNDRLPEENNQWLLGWYDGLKRPMPCSYNKAGKFIDADGFEETITHWKPLPNPQKPQKDERKTTTMPFLRK